MAVVSLRKSRLKELVESGSESANAVMRLRENPESFLATVQIGITVVGATASAFGGSAVSARLQPVLNKIEALAPYSETLALAIVVTIVSYLSLVLGELVPKSLALRSSEGYSLLIARPLLGLSWLAKPLVWFLTASSNIFLRFFGDKTSFTEGRLSAEELQQMVDEAARGGSVDPRAGDIASRAIEFGDLTAYDVMIGRDAVISIDKEGEQDELRAAILSSRHSRLPVYENRNDNIVGYISIREIMAQLVSGKALDIPKMMRELYYAHESMRAVDVLQELQKKRLHVAIVVDEHGAMSGMVTVEDLIEELVGDIFSEFDTAVSESVKEQKDGTYIIQGNIHIREINRVLSLDLPEEDGYSTVAGLVITQLGRIPQVGSQVTLEDGVVLEVIEGTPRKIRSVRLSKPAPEVAAGA